MSQKPKEPDVKEAEPVAGPTVLEATYWSRFGGHQVGPHIKFQAFFPGDSTQVVVPDHLLRTHGDNNPQGFRSSYTTRDPGQMAVLDAACVAGNNIILIAKKDVAA